MKHDWPLIRKTFFVGLLLTGLDVFLVISGWWLEGGELWLVMVIGPFLLICSCFMVFAYFLIARHGASHLPENWDELSLEEKHDFAEKRAREQKKRLTLWLLRLSDSQRHRGRNDTSCAISLLVRWSI